MCYFVFFIGYLHFGSFSVLLFHSLGLGFFCDSKGLFPSSPFSWLGDLCLSERGYTKWCLALVIGWKAEGSCNCCNERASVYFQSATDCFLALLLVFSLTSPFFAWHLGRPEMSLFHFSSTRHRCTVLPFPTESSLFRGQLLGEGLHWPSRSVNRPLLLPLFVFILVGQIFLSLWERTDLTPILLSVLLLFL